MALTISARRGAAVITEKLSSACTRVLEQQLEVLAAAGVLREEVAQGLRIVLHRGQQHVRRALAHAVIAALQRAQHDLRRG